MLSTAHPVPPTWQLKCRQGLHAMLHHCYMGLLPYSESSLSSFPSEGLGSLGVEDDLWCLPPDEKPSTHPSAKRPMT